MMTQQNSPGDRTLVTVNRIAVILLWIAYGVVAYYLTGTASQAVLHAIPIILVSAGMMYAYKGDRATAFQPFPLLSGMIIGISFIALGLFDSSMLSLWTVPFIVMNFAVVSTTRRRTAKDIGV